MSSPRRRRPTPQSRERSPPSRRGGATVTRAASMVDDGEVMVVREFGEEDPFRSSSNKLYGELQIQASNTTEPRSFPYSVKQKCWEKAEKVKGREPERWRRDPLGNIVFRKFVGCPGCMCHDYDHIVPYSKGGKSTLDNCQVLQATVNRAKGNRMELSRAELIQKSSYCHVSGRDMDLIELSAYGNVHRDPDSGGGCRIQ